MKHAYGVGIVLLLAFGTLSRPAAAQTGQAASRTNSQLGRNYPNPFNPTTRIPFTLTESAFAGGRKATVTLRIYNQLHELVAIPIALNHPNGSAAKVEKLEYSAPGDYETYWEGMDKYGKKVASGLYFYQLEVNGERSQPKVMIVSN